MVMNDRPILITGAARSGTSFTAGIIHYCGAFGGILSGPTRHNKRGMFENHQIREHVKKPLLRSLGVDPKGQHPLPPRDLDFVIERAAQFRADILSVMKNEGWDGRTPWFYKGAKACLVWRIWHKAFPLAKWVVVRRDLMDIARSCIRTGFMSKYKDLEGWLAWGESHERRFEDMKQAGLDVIEVWPHKALAEGNLEEYRQMIISLGLTWDKVAIQSFVSPELWNGGK
jgi:hypothetical protein